MNRVLLFCLCLTACGTSDTPPDKGAESRAAQSRLLVIGLDGTRADALAVAKVPNLTALAVDGSVNLDAITNDISLSGPGWASMLSGVWCDKHGVRDNDATWPLSRFDEYPHFLRRVEAAQPDLITASVSHWAPINDEILCASEAGDDCPVDFVSSPATDAGVRDEAVKLLKEQNPHALFLQFDDIDHAGHGETPLPIGSNGFCPFPDGDTDYRGQTGACTAADFNPAYVATLELTDGYIGDILSAVHARPDFLNENWLVLVSADHGGGGMIKNQHGFPHAQDRRTFLIVSGPGARALPAAQLKLVDVAATALAHLGIPLDPAWNLDGQPVGIASAGLYQDRPVPGCVDALGLYPMLPL